MVTYIGNQSSRGCDVCLELKKIDLESFKGSSRGNDFL